MAHFRRAEGLFCVVAGIDQCGFSVKPETTQAV
jgi:hypothetical protein